MSQVKRNGVKLPHLGGKGNVGMKDTDSSFNSAFNFFLLLQKEANIFSTVNLCVLPVEKLVVQPTSLITLSISEVRLVASPSSEFALITRLATSRLIASPTSIVALSTAVT